MKYQLYTNASSWMLQLSEFVWTLPSSTWVVFKKFFLIDTTGRSKISSDQTRYFFAVVLYPLLFFANTPFNFALCNRDVQRQLVLQPTVHVSQHLNVHQGPGRHQEPVLLDLESAVSIFFKRIDFLSQSLIWNFVHCSCKKGLF